MKKQLYILFTTLVLSFTAAQEKPAVDKAFIQENKKLCDAKNQSSPEALLKSIVACQNVGRNSELLPLMYLGSEKDDYLLDSSETGFTVDSSVGFEMDEDGDIEEISLSDWRDNMKESLKAQDKAYDTKTAVMMQLTSIGDFKVKESSLLQSAGKDARAGTVSFKGINITDEDAQEVSSEIYVIQVDKKFYLFNLPL